MSGSIRNARRGQPLTANGWRGAYYGSTGDLEWFVLIYKWKRYYRCNNICELCPASQVLGEHLFTNVLDAAFFNWPVANSEYLQHRPSPFTQTPGWDVWHVFFDLMHVVFKGIGMDITGGAIVILCLLGFYGEGGEGDIEIQLRRCYKRFKDWQFANNLHFSLPPFTLKFIGRNADSVLERRRMFAICNTKAYQTKVLLFFLQEETAKLACLRPDSQVAQVVAACLYGMCGFHKVIDAGGTFLSADECRQAKLFGNICLQSYVFLARWGTQEGQAVFRLRPKLHYFHHIVHGLEWHPNPKRTSVWGGEDFIGWSVRIANATSIMRCSHRTLERYRLLLYCRRRWKVSH